MNLWGLPSWLFWTAGASALVSALLLHFLRVRSRPVTVPTILFWREALKEQAPRVLFRRLSRWGSLFLVLAVLLFLLLSAGEPGPSGENAEYRVYLLDPAVASLPDAREEAAALLEKSLPGRGRARCALLEATLPPRTLASLGDPPQALPAALAGLERAPLPAWRDWRRGLEAARALLAGRKKASILVLAVDPRGLPAGKTLPGGISLKILHLPAPLWDDGIQAALPVRAAGGEWDVLLVASRRGKGGPVRSFTVRTSSGREVTKLLDDRNGPARVLLRGLPSGDRVKAFLSGKDAFQGNDRLSLEVPREEGLSVYAPGAGPVLGAALGAVEGLRLVKDPSSADVAVLRKAGAASRLSSLPALLLGAAAGVDPRGQAAAWRTASLHPLVKGLSFAGVKSPCLSGRTSSLLPLVRNRDGVVAGIAPAAPGRILLAADPEDKANGLWENPDFPRFFRRALRALSGLPFPEDGLSPGSWGSLRKGWDGGALEFREDGFHPAGLPLREGLGEFPFFARGKTFLGGLPGPALSGGGPPLAGLLRKPGAGPESPPGGGLPPAFWLGLLGLFFLTLEWWAFNRGRAA